MTRPLQKIVEYVKIIETNHFGAPTIEFLGHKWYTIPKAAEILSVPRQTMWSWYQRNYEFTAMPKITYWGLNYIPDTIVEGLKSDFDKQGKSLEESRELKMLAQLIVREKDRKNKTKIKK